MANLFSTVLFLIVALFFLSGCSTKHTYITPDGRAISTSAIGLQTMAIRDQKVESDKSFNQAIKGASDFQSFALTVNKITSPAQRIEREPTVSEEAREWAGLFLRYFGGGWFNSRKSETKVESYVINGDGNTMAGIKNQASSEQGDVRQELTSESTPNKEETAQNWIQDGALGSANGSAQVTDAEDVPATVKP